MKRPDNFLLNTTAPAGRLQGQAINDPGGSTGSGVDQEIYNDPAYAVIAVSESWKEGGISNTDEKTDASDMRDAMEEMVSKKISGLLEYAPATNYAAPGTLTDLVMWKGFQFINISDVGNLGNDPLLNPDLWFKIPKVDKLMDQYFSGEPISGGLSPLADRAGLKYLQNLLFGNYRLGGNGDDFYNFFRVALDGTQLTGDVTLEAIFKPGLAGEYFNIDLIAPDVLGTRTIIDMGGRVTESMTAGGGFVPTIGEVHDDYMQRILGDLGTTNQVFRTSTTPVGQGAGALNVTSAINNVLNTDGVNHWTGRISFDSANSISPNPAKTDDDRTAHAALVTGISYIIVMQAV